MQKENMTTKQKTLNVTTNSMAGIASKELQAQKWWPHVHRRTDVMQTSLPGWVKIILQWLKVQSLEKSAFTGLETVARSHSPFKWRTVGPTTSTSWFLQKFVRPVTVALTNRGQMALLLNQYWWLFRDVIAISLLSGLFHLKTATKMIPDEQGNEGKRKRIIYIS